MRLGVYGGTFDPIHYGHLLLAESCRESARLDEVWLIPAATSPHKVGNETSSGVHRLQMVQLAIGGHEAFRACDFELQRGGVSYTVETLEWLHQQRPADELFLILGADSLIDLPRWRAPERICELAIPLVAHRPGAVRPDYRVLDHLMASERLTEARSLEVSMPLIDLSSREIRYRVSVGRSIRFRTPRAVEVYIATHGLYLSAPEIK